MKPKDSPGNFLPNIIESDKKQEEESFSDKREEIEANNEETVS